jgi:hypothetical protein
MKISHLLASFSWQSASLPGSAVESRALFLRVSSRAFLAASRARLAVTHFSMMTREQAGVFLQKPGQPVRDCAVDQRADIGVPEFGLRLPLELRFHELDGDDRGQALADVLAGERGVAGL